MSHQNCKHEGVCGRRKEEEYPFLMYVFLNFIWEYLFKFWNNFKFTGKLQELRNPILFYPDSSIG
jgi:hypothetical protein